MAIFIFNSTSGVWNKQVEFRPRETGSGKQIIGFTFNKTFGLMNNWLKSEPEQVKHCVIKSHIIQEAQK